MSIGFTLTGTVRRTQSLVETAQKLARERGYGLSTWDDGLRFTLCPMGELSLSWKREGGLLGQWLVEGSCCSTPAGAGLHKAALELVGGLGLKSLRVDDETGYFQHRDFPRMKREHFYPWLNTLVGLCRKQPETQEYRNLCLCWGLDLYQPEDVPGTVVTPVGRFSIQTLLDRVERQGVQGFAHRFFLWDEEERDARFYRNRALHTLWEKCYFAPSSRSEEDAQLNRSALEDLERAAQMDPNLPLPRAVYREVCALDGWTPALPEGPELEEDFPAGYRKGLIVQPFGDLRITLPGSYRYEWEEWENGGGTNLWAGPAPGGPIWRVNGYRRNEGDAEFSPHLDGLNGLEERNIPNGRARWGWAELEEDGASFYQVQCEVISGPSLFYLSVTYSRPEDRETILSLLEKLSAVSGQPDQQRTHTYDLEGD